MNDDKVTASIVDFGKSVAEELVPIPNIKCSAGICKRFFQIIKTLVIERTLNHDRNYHNRYSDL